MYWIPTQGGRIQSRFQLRARELLPSPIPNLTMEEHRAIKNLRRTSPRWYLQQVSGYGCYGQGGLY